MSPSASLSAVFLSNAPPGWVQKAQTQPWIEATLGEMIDTARSTWPDIELDPALFVTHVASLLDPDTGVDELHASDLYLAAACLAHDTHAMAAIENLLTTTARRYYATAGTAMTDEVMQLVRIKLLVGSHDNPPKLVKYAGQGSLAAWLRVVMARQVFDMQRRTTPEFMSDQIAECAASGTEAVDPEIELLKHQYRDDFKQAFAAALEQLSDRERGVLRLHVVGKMNIDRIATACGIGRSTAARWLANIREQILETTREVLSQRLTMPLVDAQSIIRALRSDYALSVERLLAEHESAVGGRVQS